ncbi:hypothetical protein [Deinococcus pimensis]|uniref:hypothetical protein n=1 Tax=Deinococcus pimensis TaxID=309888 RepID=UPI0004B547EA|nr:hypothetical protein [Deinococcus pimensis]
MGVYVTFHLGAPDGLFAHFLCAPLGAYLAWLEASVEAFPEDFLPGAVDVLRDLVRRGRPALEEAAARRPDVLDDLLTWYYPDFALREPAARLESASPTMLPDRFFETLESVLRARSSIDAADLMAYLPTGRGIITGAPRHARLTDQDPGRLSFWTLEEARLLRTLLDGPSEAEHLTLDPDRAALPAVHEAVTLADERGTGLIIPVG